MSVLQKISHRKKFKAIQKQIKVQLPAEKIIGIYLSELEILSDKMDKRDNYLRKLEKYFQETKEIPNNHLPAWTGYLTEGRYLKDYENLNFGWRNLPGVYRKIKKAAVKAAVNKINKGN